MPLIYSIDQAPLYILLHLAAAITAVPLGALVLFRRKGTVQHRWLGRIWAFLMLYVAIGSFWIQARDRLSFIHILSAVIIVNLCYAIWAIRHKNVKGHRISMLCSYASLCGAGAFTILPYRMLGQLVFG